MPRNNPTVDVILHSNGNYWQAHYTDSAGKKKRKSLGAKSKITKEQAQQTCNRIAAELIADPAMRDRSKAPTLGELKDLYLNQREDKIARPTYILHRTVLTRACEYFGEDRRIDTITRANAMAWRLALPTDYPTIKTETSICGYTRVMKTVINYAKDQDLIGFNPFDRLKGQAPPPDEQWVYVPVEDIEKVIAKCVQCNMPRVGRFFAIARYAGLRRGEIYRLTWDDIDFDNRIITVRSTSRTKTTKQATRTVPLRSELHDHLIAYAHGDDKPGDLNRRQRILLKTWAAKAGVDGWDKPSHDLRKSCETDWLAKFPHFDVCKWMGHTPTVASNHYHQTTAETFRSAAGLDAPDLDLDNLTPTQKADLISKLNRSLRGSSPNTKTG